MNTYYVTRIEEPDFGCEGRPEGQEIKDKVFLKQETTKEEIKGVYKCLKAGLGLFTVLAQSQAIIVNS